MGAINGGQLASANPARDEYRRGVEAKQRWPDVGAPVVGSDGHEVGTLSAVREDHLIVLVGMVNKQNLFVPLDGIAVADGTEVILKIPAGEVTAQGWQVPPGAHHEHATPALPEVPQTTLIQTAGYSAGTLSAPEAQGFVKDIDADDDEVLANRAIDPDAAQALDDDR